MKTSIRYKIYLAAVLWLIMCGVMFFYVFTIFDKASATTLDNIWKESKDFRLLKAEQDSYKQAKQDLEELKTKPLQPEDFFSQDVTLVREIQVLESLGKKYNVILTLSGIGGNINTAPKAQTLSNIVTIPYSISLQGTYNNIINVMEVLENLDFISNFTSLSVSGTTGDNVNVSLSTYFYLRKK